MRGSTSWGTEVPGGGPLARCGAALLLAAVPVAAATPAELRDLFARADKAVRRAEEAAPGRDPGRVSLLLQRADEEIARFQEASGLVRFEAARRAALEAATGGNFAAAAREVERARGLWPPLSDFVVTRLAEESGRAALQGARDQDLKAVKRALERLDRAVLAGVLLDRLDASRRAIARARAALVRRDLKGGAPEIAAARAGLSGLAYAGALGRAALTLTIGSELLREGALIAARDQARQAARDLRLACDLAPPSERAALETLRDEATALWRRMNRPQAEDADRLAGVAAAVAAARERLGAGTAPAGV
jgi:hypothetical protein